MITSTKVRPEVEEFPNAGRATKSGIRGFRQDGTNRTLLFSDLPNYKNILLLQGPVGPFFKNLGDYWRNRGSNVTKVNFNSGDDLFYPPIQNEVIQYKSRLNFWPSFLSELLVKKKIKAVFLFGDCRAIHLPVRSLCEMFDIDCYVLEEGYIRPHLFTLEKKGVNFYSNIKHLNVEAICNDIGSKAEPRIRQKFNHSYWHMVRHAIAYWFVSLINKSNYPDYEHHRELNLLMGFRWTRSFLRYWLYQVTQWQVRNILCKPHQNQGNSRWFLLPLQVHDDPQLTTHSDFESIEHILETVISSFANHLQHTGRADLLIIKHHPMDRGHHNFRAAIKELGKLYQIEEKIIYIHTISLPLLLKKISGCVTVNSTMGLQALHHQVPVINLGRSFYDKPGITFQGSLEEFWMNANKVNSNLIKSFRNYLLHHAQVNGSLYDPKYRIE
jgi:capsular polysaccharide export protein